MLEKRQDIIYNMKLLGSAKVKITEDKNWENLPRLEITDVVSVHCNIANNDYHQDPSVLFTYGPNKSFGQSWVFQNFIF